MSINDNFIKSQTTLFIKQASNNINADLKHNNAPNITNNSSLPEKSLATTAMIKLGSFENSITCNWEYVKYATNYKLERADDIDFTYNKVLLYSDKGNYFIDTNLISNKIYYYKVTAIANGYFGHGLEKSTKTLNEIPSGNIFISKITDSCILLNWLPISGVINYIVEKSTVSDFSSNVNTIYSDSGFNCISNSLNPTTHYYYRMHGENENSININYVYIDAITINGLSAPQNLGMGNVYDTSVTLSWESVENATNYILQKALNNEYTESLTTVYSGPLLTFTNTGLTPAQQLYYRVKATAENFNDSTFTNGITKPDAVIAAPDNFQVQNVTQNEINLVWDVVDNANTYIVERATNINFITNLTTVYNGPLLTFNNTGLIANTTYYYRIHGFKFGYTVINYSTLNETTLSNT